MSLQIVIGFDRRGASAKPALVYLGRSGSEAEAAMKADTQHACFLRLPNPVGLMKNNPNFLAPVADEAASVEPPVVESAAAPASASPKRRERRA